MVKTEARAEGATAEQILAAATRLFAERGFAATSLKDVAEEVGIRKQSLLYHVGSKDELRQRVLDGLLLRWNDVLPRLLYAATTGEDQFEAVVAETIEFFVADVDRARLLLREILDRPGEVESLLATRVAPWVEVVCGYIEKGKSHGKIDPSVDGQAYVLVVISSILSCVAMADSMAGIASAERQREELRRMARSSLFLTGQGESR